MPDHLLLTWSGNPASTQTITWRTDSTVASGVVQYQVGRVLTAAARGASAMPHNFTTDINTTHLFTVTLSGLSPHTTYVYRVGDGTHWSAAHTFLTADPHANAFKFLVFGDSQSGMADRVEYDPWRVTVQKAYSANPDARFIVNMGDMVEVGQSAAHWGAWFNAAQGVIDSIPEMAVPGNHENYVRGSSATKPVFWSTQFPLPQNGPAGLKNQVYSYNYGPVHFVVLDSQQDEEKAQYGDILAAQKSWLAADLAASKATWKIVLFHKTPYYLMTRPNEAIKAAFCPILDKYHVDLVLNGHDHAVGRTYPIAHDTLMRKPSQGTIYYVTGRSGNRSYPNLAKRYWNAFFYNPTDEPNYLVVAVAGTTLTIHAVKQDGTLIDTFVLDKAKNTDSDVHTPWTKFAHPVLAIDGTLVSTATPSHVPRRKNGHWFVDAGAFTAAAKGTLVAQGGAVTLSVKNRTAAKAPVMVTTTVTGANLLADNGVFLVAVDALKPLGFSAAFHPEINVLNLTK
jgi:hypothetical protein